MRNEIPKGFDVPEALFWADFVTEMVFDEMPGHITVVHYHYTNKVTGQSADLWLENKRILSPEEAEEIVFVEKPERIFRGHYARHGERLRVNNASFILKETNSDGDNIWEIKAGGVGGGEIWTVTEKDGDILKFEQDEWGGYKV